MSLLSWEEHSLPLFKQRQRLSSVCICSLNIITLSILMQTNVLYFFTCVSSTRGFRSWEIRQIMWYVVSGCDHVHPVSITTVSITVNKSYGVHHFKLAEMALFLFMLHEGCVDSHHSTPTQDRPFHREWSGVFAWASTSFPAQSGLKYLRRVRCILCLFCTQSNVMLPVYHQRVELLLFWSLYLHDYV